ncbi:hypothetical protein EC991_005063 [Linnemannia zychae]|nr:hypothetical protein EC991_005063 [Linnemannia zychae]
MCKLDKVIAIEELQGLICRDLSHKDVKDCTLVCRAWNRLWGRMLWTQIRLFKHHHKNSDFLERQGGHIQLLSCEFVDSTVVTAITQFCPTLRSLYLHLDYNSAEVEASALDEMFQRMKIRLTKVHIRFDATFVNPMVLLGLARLSQLTELFLDPYLSKASKDDLSMDAYMSILNVCATLQSFICGGCFLEIWGKARQLTSENEIVAPLETKNETSKGDRGSAGLFTAQSRSLSSSQTSPNSQVTPLTKTEVKPLILTPSAPTLIAYNFRRLHIQSSPLDIIDFYRLIGLCPLLEELTLRREQGAFTHDAWKTLSDLCPRLRLIRFENVNMSLPHTPDLAAVVTDFSCLECLELVNCEFDKDPDLIALGTRLEELYQQRNETPHPLRRLQITGVIDQSTQVLADAFAALGSSTLLQFLTIGKTSSPIKRDGHGKVIAPEWDENAVDFSTITPLRLESLRVLDVTMVNFTKVGLKQFFSLIPRHCIHLNSLGLSSCHSDYLREYKISEQLSQVEHPNISFPSLRTVLFGFSYPRTRYRCYFFVKELALILDALPGLKKVGLRTGVEIIGDVEHLRKQFWRVKIVVLLPSQAGDFFE